MRQRWKDPWGHWQILLCPVFSSLQITLPYQCYYWSYYLSPLSSTLGVWYRSTRHPSGLIITLTVTASVATYEKLSIIHLLMKSAVCCLIHNPQPASLNWSVLIISQQSCSQLLYLWAFHPVFPTSMKTSFYRDTYRVDLNILYPDSQASHQLFFQLRDYMRGIRLSLS